MPVNFKNVVPILDVRDMDEALRYYVEKLGFQVEFRWTEDPSNYAGVHRDGVYLHLQWQDRQHFEKGTAGKSRLRILIEDPDVLFEEYRRKGVVGGDVQVKDTSWGTREFGFRDLDGNGLIFYRDV